MNCPLGIGILFWRDPMNLCEAWIASTFLSGAYAEKLHDIDAIAGQLLALYERISAGEPAGKS